MENPGEEAAESEVNTSDGFSVITEEAPVEDEALSEVGVPENEEEDM